jgi:dTDP-4-amino-4,6-dideoxy-D-galactose acyltransferase
MSEQLRALIYKRITDLSVYSPFSFLKDKDAEVISGETLINPLLSDIDEGYCKVEEIVINKKTHYFIYRNLKWDSDHFKFSINRIELILFDHQDPDVLNKALKVFTGTVIKPGEYFFTNVPCEEIVVIQALANTSFRLVETRLNYYLSDLAYYESQRFPVRKADHSDIMVLKNIAVKMRNKYDRVHADPAFTSKEADNYLGTFIEESVKGFADMVLVPDIKGIEPFGFLAANNSKKVLGRNIAKLVLAAVDNSQFKDWLFKLLSEVIYELKEQSADYLTTITQASNRKAIRTWEKAGFKLGCTTHIFSCGGR